MRSLIFVALALFILTGFSACEDRPKDAEKPVIPELPKVEDPAKPAVGKDGKPDPLAQAKYEMQLYAEKAAQTEARYEVLKRQATDDAIRSQTAWITGICLLLASIAGVAAFFVPLGKKTLVAAALGFTCVAACAQAFQWAIPYLPWIGGAMVVGGAVWALFSWDKLGKVAKTAAGYGDRVEEWLQDLPEEARAQANKVIADAKAEAKKQAEALNIHGQLQTLRGKAPALGKRIVSALVNK